MWACIVYAFMHASTCLSVRVCLPLSPSLYISVCMYVYHLQSAENLLKRTYMRSYKGAEHAFAAGKPQGKDASMSSLRLPACLCTG